MAVGLITSPAAWVNGTVAPAAWFQNVQDTLNDLYTRTGDVETGIGDVSIRVSGLEDILDPFGDGSDGSVYTGSNVMARDMYFANMTIVSGEGWNTGGWAIHCSGTFTLAAGGVLHCDGQNASGFTGARSGTGPHSAMGELHGGGIVATGGLNGGFSGGLLPGLGGNGGPGGSASQSGGFGWEMQPSLDYRRYPYRDGYHLPGPVTQLSSTYENHVGSMAGKASLRGGGNGGGGAGANPATGGGGGGGGGLLVVIAREIVLAGVLSSLGGNGGAASGGNTGGGGGGGGGAILLISSSITGTPSAVTVTGGAGGAGAGTGAPGSVGVDGNATPYVVLL